MDDTHPRWRGFLFVANDRCLDFVNTQCRPGADVLDLLSGFSDLIAWLRAAGLIDQADARHALGKWSASPQAARALHEARKFRATLRRMAEAFACGRSISPGAVKAINEILARRSWRYGLVPARRGFERKLLLNLSEPRDLLVPVAFAAAELLSERDLTRVRRCKNPNCVGFFYDSSKNRRRRWCSMALCGNRAKAVAHYRRSKSGIET